MPLTDRLPQVGITAITNAIQSYLSIAYTRRVYPGLPASSTSIATKTTKITTTIEESTASPAGQRPSVTTSAYAESHPSPVTPLASRLWGTWCMAVGIVRIHAAYNFHEKSWYQMSMWTNVIGLIHYLLEAFVYKTSRPQGPWLAPTTVALIGLVWHIVQYSDYIK